MCFSVVKTQWKSLTNYLIDYQKKLIFKKLDFFNSLNSVKIFQNFSLKLIFNLLTMFWHCRILVITYNFYRSKLSVFSTNLVFVLFALFTVCFKLMLTRYFYVPENIISIKFAVQIRVCVYRPKYNFDSKF